jgi:hypothetical protein
MLCRNKTMRGAKGPNTIEKKKWDDKRRRKIECNLGDKMLMNNSR